MKSESVTYESMAGLLQPELLAAIKTMGYENMTPVQQEVLSLPSFTADCLVQAKTGTGKTTAFLLPILQTLLTTKNLPSGKVLALIIAPTRELAAQIGVECNKLTKFCKTPIECHLAYGGSNKNTFLTRFLKGRPSILVATPGRLLDYLQDDKVRHKFSSLRSLVLDEADSLLDKGFFDDLLKILRLLPSKQDAKWQGMCFSATMPPKINEVLHHILKPEGPDSARISTITETEAPTVDAIPQSLIAVNGIDSVITTLHTVLSCEQLDNPALKAVVFTHTARNAGILFQLFSVPGVSPGKLPVYQMHSRMSQTARNKTVDAYKQADHGLLFASDVVGRGMDFPDIGLVVQIGIPMNSEQYVHRVGRTGRAGKVGRAVIILAPEEMVFVRKNPQFPIKNTGLNHPKASSIPSSAIVEQALAQIDEQSKEQAYSAFLGYVKTHGRAMNLKGPDMVALANVFSESLGCELPPALEARTIGKMGLKGVKGLRIKRPTPGGEQGGVGEGSQRPNKKRR